MLRYNTTFLLKATAVCAAGCLPMAIVNHDGIVLSAFAIPFGLALFVATQIDKQGQYEIKFKRTSESGIEIQTIGGRQGQWVTTNRILVVGAFAAFAAVLTTLNITGKELPRSLTAIAAVFALVAFSVSSCSSRRLVLERERAFATDYLLFGWLRWARRLWQVHEGDYLAVFIEKLDQEEGTPEFGYKHSLYVCRSKRRQAIAIGYFTSSKIVRGMETSARRIAKLVHIPYDGYHESKGFWWP